MRNISLAVLACILGSTAAQAQNLTLPSVSVEALQAPIDVAPRQRQLHYRLVPTGRSVYVRRSDRLGH